VFGGAGAILYVFDFPSSFGAGFAVLVSIGITSAISYGIYRLGLFGGADALALIIMSAILPIYSSSPSLVGNLISFSTTTLHPVAPLIVLTNAVFIFSISLVAWNVIRNLRYSSKNPRMLFEGLQHEPISKKILAVIIGHRSEKNPQYAFSIERKVNGKREFDFAPKPAETREYDARKGVWVTSAAPFLVYMAAGLIVMVAGGGDLMAIIFKVFH
jgi:preflagellin peptidase FlaK